MSPEFPWQRRRPEQDQDRGFVRHVRTGFRGKQQVVSFQLSSLRIDEPSVVKEVPLPVVFDDIDEATREGFRLLRQDLSRMMGSSSVGGDHWLHRRLGEMIASLDRETRDLFED